MLGALHYADAITTVSPTYAGEIQTPEFGEGLDGVLRERSYALQGILNGIDVASFDPATDKRIAANYTVDDRSGKAVCKAKLQEELGLEVRDDRPLMVMVTRLTRQKGMDLVMYALDRILAGGVQVAVLGTGDRDYEDGLRYFQDKYPGTMAARIEFDPALSQRMYAAADMFLMPSKFEPCGLSQIIAMRYGTLPIVRETGGLKDTVIPYNEFTGEGTGFSFTNFNGDEMGDAVFRAARLFWDNRDAWNQLVTQAMSQDFSWTRSADKYLDLYFFMHPEIERPAAVAESEEPEAVESETVAPVKEPAAAEEPKAEEKPVEAKPVKADPEVKVEAAPDPEPEVKPAAKPATKKTTTRKATAKKATTTKAAASKTTAAKATTAKASTSKTTTTRKRTTVAAKKAAEAEIAPEVKAAAEAKPAAKAPAKTAAKKTTASKTTTGKKTTATKSKTNKAATTKAAAKTTPKAAAKPAVKVKETGPDPKAEAAVEAKPAAKTTTRKRSTTTAKKTTTKTAASKAEAKAEDKSAVKAEPAPKAAEVKTAPKATAKAEPAKETPVSPAAPTEEKAPTKKTSVRKATAARKRH